MKRFTALLFCMVLVFMCGCGNVAEDKNIAPSAENTVKVNFEKFGAAAAEDINFIVVVNPSDEQKASIKITKTVSAGAGEDEIYIMPKNDGSRVDVCAATFNIGSVNIKKGSVIDSETLDKNECLLIKTLIPEGIPSHLLTLKAPGEEEVTHVINYNGKGDVNVHFR